MREVLMLLYQYIYHTLPNGKLIIYDNNTYQSNLLRLLTQSDYNTLNNSIQNIINTNIPNAINDSIIYGRFTVSGEKYKNIKIGRSFKYIYITSQMFYTYSDGANSGCATMLATSNDTSEIHNFFVTTTNVYPSVSQASVGAIRFQMIDNTTFKFYLNYETTKSIPFRYICFT